MKRRDLLRAALALPLLDLRPPRDDREVAALLWHDSPNDLKAFAGFRRGFSVVDRAAPAAPPRRTRCRARRGHRGEAPRRRREAADRARDQAALLTKRISGGLRSSTRSIGRVRRGLGVGGLEQAIAGNSNWLDRGEMLRAFRTAIPDLKRLGVVATRGNAVSAAEIAEAEGRDVLVDPAGRSSKVFLGPEDDLGAALDALLPRVDALWVPIDFALYQDEAVWP
ncbi:MAG: hypothetical protein R3F20_10650 [Planctomycetota bacterium]